MELHRGAYQAVLPKEVARFFFVLLALCLAFKSDGQDVKAISRDHKWGGAAVWRSAWDAPSVGTEILSDDLSIRIRNTKPQFLALFFERRQVIRFGSEEDILKHTRFTLPESLDPVYDQRHTPWTERGEMPTPMWFNVRLDVFAARIIRPDGTWGEVGVFSSVEREQVRTIRGQETAWTYVLDLQSIAPGDVVEVHWKYMIPYDNNWESTQGWRAFHWMDNWSRLTSWRIFFHDAIPIRDQRVSITYHLKHGLVLGGAVPSQRSENGDQITCAWENKDLFGCMDEVNARPAEDLPHVTVLFAPEDLRYWRRDRLSGMPIEQPHWLQVMRTREAKAQFWERVAKKRVPDRQNTLIKEFVEENTGHLPDSMAAQRMAILHDLIAQEFTYEDDHLWYMDIDRGLPRMGDQVNEERLRDISRYDLYAKLAYAVGLHYSTAYVLDRRIGRMNDRWTTPMWDSEFLLGVRNGDRMQWMHPKRTRYGQVTDELPYYWQGSPALLMNLERLLVDDPGPALFVDLPTADAAANTRVIEYVLDLDLERLSATGMVRTYLSGQFSTLGRAAYFGAAIDSTVDPLYGKRSTDVEGLVVRTQQELDFMPIPPFRFRMDAEIQVDGLVRQEPDGSYLLDLARFMGHVVPPDFTADDRDLPFHWDFEQDDRYVITIRSPVELEVLNTDVIERSATSPSAKWERSITGSGDELRIESRLVVGRPKEEVENAKDLERVLDGAKERGLELRFKATLSGP